jgi:hypothetical protein
MQQQWMFLPLFRSKSHEQGTDEYDSHPRPYKQQCFHFFSYRSSLTRSTRATHEPQCSYYSATVVALFINDSNVLRTPRLWNNNCFVIFTFARPASFPGTQCLSGTDQPRDFLVRLKDRHMAGAEFQDAAVFPFL